MIDFGLDLVLCHVNTRHLSETNKLDTTVASPTTLDETTNITIGNYRRKCKRRNCNCNRSTNIKQAHRQDGSPASQETCQGGVYAGADEILLRGGDGEALY